MTEKEWLGEDNELGLNILCKYRKSYETMEEFFERVSVGDEETKKLIIEQKLLLGGRTFANRGILNSGSYFNCYSVGYVGDSLKEILRINTILGLTYKAQGGQGLSLTKIRPANTKVGKEYTSDGIVPFMELFNQTTASISQGGTRKGALMMSIDIRHKEAETFIKVKSDLGKINKANLSLEIDDKFMQAVKKYYDTGEEIVLHEKRDYNGHIVKYDVIPIKLYKLLCQNSYDYAEPACLFVNRFRNYNIMEYDKEYNIECGNPCIAKGGLIQTVEGLIPIENLVGETPYLYCMDNDGKLSIDKAKKVFLTKKQAEVVKIYTLKGDLICTPDHLIMTINRGWVKAQDLKMGDKIKGLNRAMASEKWLKVGLSGDDYEREHRFVLRHFQNIEGLDVHHKDNNPFNNNLSNLESMSHSEHSKISNTGRKIEYNRDLGTGRFLCKSNKKQKECMNQNIKIGSNWFVKKVEKLTEKYDVYDIQMENYHNFIAEGFVVHNCGEQPLCKNSCCCLSSLNLSKYIINPFKEYSSFDYKEFEKDIYTAIKTLDKLIDENKDNHAIPEQKEMSLNYRNIGLGVFGYASALMKLGLMYGSKEALEFTDYLFEHMFRCAVFASNKLAKEKGCFPKYSDVVWDSKIIQKHFTKEEIKQFKKDGLRNCSLLSIAPTGSIASMVRETGGIEPEFALEYTRKTESVNAGTYTMKCKALEEYLKVNRDHYGAYPTYFIASKDIPWKQRVDTQAIIQNHIDTAISSTVNLPNSATVEDIEQLYLYAWEQGIKGITIYRDGCKREGILSTDKDNKNNLEIEDLETSGDLLNYIIPVTREELGQRLEGATYTKEVACGHIYITVNKYKNNLVEVFVDSSKSGTCSANTEAIGRLCSSALRSGASVESVVDSIKGIKCGACQQVKGSKSKLIDGISCADVIARVIEEEWKYLQYNAKDNEVEEKKEETINTYVDHKLICPECKSQLTASGGCWTCLNCGYSKCD